MSSISQISNYIRIIFSVDRLIDVGPLLIYYTLVDWKNRRIVSLNNLHVFIGHNGPARTGVPWVRSVDFTRRWGRDRPFWGSVPDGAWPRGLSPPPWPMGSPPAASRCPWWCPRPTRRLCTISTRTRTHTFKQPQSLQFYSKIPCFFFLLYSNIFYIQEVTQCKGCRKFVVLGKVL